MRTFFCLCRPKCAQSSVCILFFRFPCGITGMHDVTTYRYSRSAVHGICVYCSRATLARSTCCFSLLMDVMLHLFLTYKRSPSTAMRCKSICFCPPCGCGTLAAHSHLHLALLFNVIRTHSKNPRSARKEKCSRTVFLKAPSTSEGNRFITNSML